MDVQRNSDDLGGFILGTRFLINEENDDNKITVNINET